MSQVNFDGELLDDAETLKTAATDFGNLRHREPRAVARPNSAQGVIELVQWAGIHGHRLVAQGERHSVFGRSQISDGFVLHTGLLDTVGEPEPDRVSVGAGATWAEVVDVALPHGLTPPVLTEYLYLTIGGTISAGGIGGASWRHGAVSDNVLELDVVTGDGRLITCSPTVEPGLFDAVRGGLGQIGVITRATLRLVAAPSTVRRYQLKFDSFSTLLAQQKRLVDNADWEYIQGAIVPVEFGNWDYLLEGAVLLSEEAHIDDEAALEPLSYDSETLQATSLRYRDFVYRFSALEEALREADLWHSAHPWLFTFVGSDAIESILTEVLATLTPSDVGQYGRLALAPVKTGAMRTPLLPMPRSDLAFALNYMRFPANGAQIGPDEMMRSNRGVFERIRASGGTLNPVSAFDMSQEDWRQHFGTNWDTYVAAKNEYDPDRVMAPGYEVFADSGSGRDG